jgi:DNA-directed RNA polymerase specialized sigma24 family protein
MSERGSGNEEEGNMNARLQFSSATTRWSLIVRAQGTGVERRAALGELLQYYEGFVLALLRSHHRPPDVTPEELKQDFLEAMLRNDDVNKLNRERGSFRAWLTVAVQRFLSKEWAKWHARKGGRKVTSLVAPEAIADSCMQTDTPDEACMRVYAKNLVCHALQLQRAEARDIRRFDALARFVPGPQLDLVPYGPHSRSLGSSTIALGKAVCLMRGRFSELLRLAVRDLNDWDGDCELAIDQELRDLRRYLFS